MPARDVARRSTIGLLLLAAGRARGLAYFGTDPAAYLASLAPLIAFSLVSASLAALGGAPRMGASLFLMSVALLLGPPVIADWFCRRWNRGERWALYANILNWASFLRLFVFVLLLIVARVAARLGAPPNAAASGVMVVLLCYMTWFEWFVTRRALEISRSRTALLLGATISFGLILIVILLVFGSEPEAMKLSPV